MPDPTILAEPHDRYPSMAELEDAYRAAELDVVADLLVRKFDAERSDEDAA